MATACARSFQAPPMNVENTSPPANGEILVTNASIPKFHVVSKAPGVVGKSLDAVVPVRTTSPFTSSASDLTTSLPPPPRNVEYVSAPEGDHRVRKPSGV